MPDLRLSNPSLSARRAWIEISARVTPRFVLQVALRKESVDRNFNVFVKLTNIRAVALRKESVDRNVALIQNLPTIIVVALRKESVDRNLRLRTFDVVPWSLSARRAWIEMPTLSQSTFELFSRSPQGERG